MCQLDINSPVNLYSLTLTLLKMEFGKRRHLLKPVYLRISLKSALHLSIHFFFHLLNKSLERGDFTDAGKVTSIYLVFKVAIRIILPHIDKFPNYP